jgi:hypothetical protein
MRWMGRWTVESFGPPMWAACGRWSVGVGVAIGASEFPLERPMELRVGTKPVGEVRRVGALGHPHSGIRVPLIAGSGDEYAGSAVFAWVAWHERMWKGESIEISKCRLLDGSTASGFERRMTSWSDVSLCDEWDEDWSYLYPVVHLNVLVRGVEV